MCGFIYNVNDFPLLEPLLDIAGYDESEIREIIRKRYLRPTDTVINLIPTRTGLQLKGATWWLATNTDGTPNTQIASFNSRAGKLASSYLHTSKPRSIRSIVVATGFAEWQPIYKGDRLYSQLPGIQSGGKPPTPARKQPYKIEQTDAPLMLLGSVSKLRLTPEGQPKVNTSVITLPPHPEFMDIHYKSFPLILRPDELENWLNPKIPMASFSDLFEMTAFRQTYRITPVNTDME